MYSDSSYLNKDPTNGFIENKTIAPKNIRRYGTPVTKPVSAVFLDEEQFAKMSLRLETKKWLVTQPNRRRKYLRMIDAHKMRHVTKIYLGESFKRRKLYHASDSCND